MFGRGGGYRVDFSIHVFQFEFVVCFSGRCTGGRVWPASNTTVSKMILANLFLCHLYINSSTLFIDLFWHLSVSLPPQSLSFLLSLSLSLTLSLSLSLSLSPSLSLLVMVIIMGFFIFMWNQHYKEKHENNQNRLICIYMHTLTVTHTRAWTHAHIVSVSKLSLSLSLSLSLACTHFSCSYLSSVFKVKQLS